MQRYILRPFKQHSDRGLRTAEREFLIKHANPFQIYKTPRLRRGVLVPKSCCS